MNDMNLRLNLLLDGLIKKEHSLLEIVSITENQGTVLESGLPPDDARAFIVQMNREKQVFIQEVLRCDSMFETVLKEIGAELDANQDLYVEEVRQLQTYIKRVMDLDVKIRVCEDRNEELMKKNGVAANPAARGLTPKKRIETPSGENLIKKYADNSKRGKL